MCSIVMKGRVHLCPLGLNLLFCDARSTEPSHSRAGLTSIGLEIKRTPLADQTSPRSTPSRNFKPSKRRVGGHPRSPRVEAAGFEGPPRSLYSVWKLRLRPTVRRGCPATSTAPSAPAGKRAVTKLRPTRSPSPKWTERASRVEVYRLGEWKRRQTTATTAERRR